MKPLILEFAEKITDEDNGYLDQIEYSSELNLSVLKDTKTPAITQEVLGTETFTKTTGEPRDPDKENIKYLLDTYTKTDRQLESGDTDYNKEFLLGTSTKTNVMPESSDSDK